MRHTTMLLVLSACVLGWACAPEREGAPSAAAGPTPPAATVTLPARITSIAAVNGSSSVAVGLADGRVAIWSPETAPLLLKPHATSVLAVGSTRDGAEVWSFAGDGSLARTPLITGAPPAVRKVDLGAAPTRAATFSADGSTLVTGGEFGDLRVFDTTTGALRHTLRGHRTELEAMAMRPGSAILATASAEADLKVWDTATGRQLLSAETDVSMFAVAFSPSDGTLASGGVDRRVTFRDVATDTATGSIDLKSPKMVASLAWSPDGSRLAIGDLDDATLSKGGLRIVNADTRLVVADLETGGVPPFGLTFVGDGRLLVAVVGDGLRAWPAR